MSDEGQSKCSSSRVQLIHRDEIAGGLSDVLNDISVALALFSVEANESVIKDETSRAGCHLMSSSLRPELFPSEHITKYNLL